MIEELRTASIDVDAQKGFSFYCPKELPVEGGHSIVPFLNKQADFAGWRIATKDCHPFHAIYHADDEHPNLSPIVGRANADIYWNKHCIAGTPGNELLPGLPAVNEYDFVVFKGMEPDMHPYGACYHDLEERLSTGLIEFLHEMAIENVILGGLATDFCVATTAKQLKQANFNVIINLQATAAILKDQLEVLIDSLEREGIIVCRTMEDLEEFVRGPKQATGTYGQN